MSICKLFLARGHAVEIMLRLSVLSRKQYKDLLVIHEVFRQQRVMFDNKVKRIEDRIVSISQPHVRPLKRGKAGSETEFGAKISVSLVEGYAFLENLKWEAYNEATDFIDHIEKYKARFGYYPESVHADRIYRNRENRKYCKKLGIRLSGPPLGRPLQDNDEYRKLLKKAKADAITRIPIEGVFGTAKRRYGLSRIMSKLSNTSATTISMTFLVMNLEKILRDFLLSLFHFFKNSIFLFQKEMR